MKTVVTHDGPFHADDVFALAVLQLVYGTENLLIKRSRDESIIAEADIVTDVGMIYDPERNRFDHHQTDAPIRENGLPYAAFGLVWKEFGEKLTTPYVVDVIDQTLAQPIDAGDNGIELYTLTDCNVQPAQLYSIISSYLPITENTAAAFDAGFVVAVQFAREYLVRLIHRYEWREEENKKAQELYEAASDKTVLITDTPISSEYFLQYADVQVVVAPQEREGEVVWKVRALALDRNTFATRVRFPLAWAGLVGEELVAASGISGAKFCHKNRFLFICDSKQGAIEAASAAIANGQQ